MHFVTQTIWGLRRRWRRRNPPTEPVALVAIDLDGTLLRGDKTMSARTTEAISQALRQGVHVVLASARPPRSVRQVYETLGLRTPQVNYNGALIHDPRTNVHLYHQPLTAELARRIAELARQVAPEVLVSLEVLDKWYTDRVDERYSTETGRLFTPDAVGPLEQFLTAPVTKLMLMGNEPQIAAVRKAVHRRFRGKVSLPVSDPDLIQVADRRVDKGRAVARIAEQLRIAPQRVMAIGDAPNDLGMLRWAGRGVAVRNAWPEVLAMADVVVPSNNDDGVAVALERFVLMT